METPSSQGLSATCTLRGGNEGEESREAQDQEECADLGFSTKMGKKDGGFRSFVGVPQYLDGLQWKMLI